MLSIPRALPPVTHGSAIQAPERLWFIFLPRIMRMSRIHFLWLNNRSKSLLLSPGLLPCSLMRMLSHVSELPCLNLPICLVCPVGRQETNKTKLLPLAVQNEPLSEATDSYLRPASLSSGCFFFLTRIYRIGRIHVLWR